MEPTNKTKDTRAKCATRIWPKGKSRQGQAIRCRTEPKHRSSYASNPPKNQRAAGRGGSNPVDSRNSWGKQGLPKGKWLAPKIQGHVRRIHGSPLDLVLFRLKGENPPGLTTRLPDADDPLQETGKINCAPSTDGGSTRQKGQEKAKSASSQIQEPTRMATNQGNTNIPTGTHTHT